MNNSVPTTQVNRGQELAKLKEYLVNAVSREMENSHVPAEERRDVMVQILQKSYQSTKLNLPNTIRDQLFHDILDDLLGFGPLQPLIEDEAISEIMVNGPKKIFIEKKGKLTKTNVTFENDQAVLRIIEKIITPLGRRVDGDTPTVDARLPDGSRVNAVIAPCALDGRSLPSANSKRIS